MAKLTGEHIKQRVANGSVRIVQRAAHGNERQRHISHIQYQNTLKARRELISSLQGWDRNRDMKLLTNEPTFGENRGRGAVKSGINLEALLEELEVDSFEEAVRVVIGLGSPFIQLSKSDGDWYGSKSKQKKILQAIVDDHDMDNVVVSERVTKNGDIVKLTFRQTAETRTTDTEEE